jgi:hypothetical protein
VIFGDVERRPSLSGRGCPTPGLRRAPAHRGTSARRAASSTITTGGVTRSSSRRRSARVPIAATGSMLGSFSSSAQSALRTLLCAAARKTGTPACAMGCVDISPRASCCGGRRSSGCGTEPASVGPTIPDRLLRAL